MKVLHIVLGCAWMKVQAAFREFHATIPIRQRSFAIKSPMAIPYANSINKIIKNWKFRIQLVISNILLFFVCQSTIRRHISLAIACIAACPQLLLLIMQRSQDKNDAKNERTNKDFSFHHHSPFPFIIKFCWIFLLAKGGRGNNSKNRAVAHQLIQPAGGKWTKMGGASHWQIFSYLVSHSLRRERK
jgi:hypothetical protein